MGLAKEHHYFLKNTHINGVVQNPLKLHCYATLIDNSVLPIERPLGESIKIVCFLKYTCDSINKHCGYVGKYKKRLITPSGLAHTSTSQ